MSFGKSGEVRFDAGGKKPLVFWQHQENEAHKPKKKFSYKEKGNKIPLRGSVNAEPEPTRNVRAPPKKAPAKPEMTASKPRSTAQQSSVTQQNVRNTVNSRGKPASKSKDKKPVPEDKVTLTQSQFDKILETIGELTLLSEEKENTDTHGAIDLSGLNSSLDVNYQSSQGQSSDPAPVQQEAPPTRPDNTEHNPTSSQPDNLAPGSTVPKLDITSPRYYDPRSVPQGPVTGNTRSSLIGVPFAHMTKAERKRMEWERQKAEDAALQKQVDHTEKLHAVSTGVAQQQQQAPPATQSVVTPQRPVQSTASTVESEQRNSQPKARVASRSSVIVNEPAIVPGLSPQSGNQPSQSQAVPSPTVHNEPQTVPGLAIPQQQTVTAVVQPAPSTTAQQPQVAARGPLTKAELKRLQWEKERADLTKQQNWDPWGKPGAGAPIKDGQGNVLADFATRKDEAVRQSFEDVNRRNQAQQPYQTQTQHPQVVVQPQQQPTVATAMAQPETGGTSGAVEAPPAAIRSSFNIGAIAPDENKYMSVKEQQRRQWLADLEKQREEQRMRKLQQIQKDAELDIKEMGYKDSYKPTVPDQQVIQVGPMSQTQAPPVAQPTYATTSVQQPSQPAQYPQPQATQPSQHPGHLPGALPSGEPSQPQTDTFLRGQNVNMDELTRRELEEKRKKQLEYQEYIKQQINEKERQKKEERERKWKEEMEIEQKLQREREDLQNQHQTDQDKVRQREENEKRRSEMLKSAMEQEKERAEWEKHEKRMLKLRKGGHDVAGYHATFQSKHTPRDGAASVLTVAPSFIPGLGTIPPGGGTGGATSVHRDNVPSQMTSYPSPVPVAADAYAETRGSVGANGGIDVRSSMATDQQYIENRVLTPSVYRSPKKEFGVQTDLLGLENLSRESTDIEYKGPIKKKVRVKSAAELKALKAAREKKKGFGSSSARPTEAPKSAPVASKVKAVKPILKKTYKKPIPINKRPAWGSSANSNKKVVKQSERDPFYEEKKQHSEERGLLRQQMLLEIAEQETPLVYNKSTAATKARSRSKSREEEEFEAPGAVHVATTKVVGSRSRSRSPGHDYSRGGASTGHHSRVDSRSDRGYSSQRSSSPPVPALKNRIITGDVTDSGRGTPSSYRRKTPTGEYVVDQYSYDNYSRTSRMDAGSRADSYHHSKYSDTLVDAPVQNGQFVPFIRSMNILDPAQAEEPLPMSREPSTMQRARQAYVQEHEPAKYGTAMENFNDSRIKENVPRQVAPNYNKDPITNPSVVTDHPSQRQNRILQQLSDLRKGLMQKQRELEVGLQAEEVVG